MRRAKRAAEAAFDAVIGLFFAAGYCVMFGGLLGLIWPPMGIIAGILAIGPGFRAGQTWARSSLDE